MDKLSQGCIGTLDFTSTIVLVAFYSVFSVISIIGNSTVLWAIYRFPHLRTPSNVFLASLAAADLSVGLIIDPLWVARCIIPQKPYRHPFKIAIDFFWLQTTFITTFNLCAVTLDRYIAVVHVLKYPNYVTLKRSLVTICSIWAFSIIFGGLRLVITNSSSLPSLWLSSLILTFIIPLIIIIACYAKILKEAHKQSRQIRQQEMVSGVNDQMERQTECSSARRKRKANVTVGIIIGLFILLWLPSLVTSLVQVSISDTCLKIKLRRVWLWVEMVAFLSSAINPWIYAVRNSEFRDAIRTKLRIF